MGVGSCAGIQGLKRCTGIWWQTSCRPGSCMSVHLLFFVCLVVACYCPSRLALWSWAVLRPVTFWRLCTVKATDVFGEGGVEAIPLQIATHNPKNIVGCSIANDQDIRVLICFDLDEQIWVCRHSYQTPPAHVLSDPITQWIANPPRAIACTALL
jgi:hypothetical protein